MDRTNWPRDIESVPHANKVFVVHKEYRLFPQTGTHTIYCNERPCNVPVIIPDGRPTNPHFSFNWTNPARRDDVTFGWRSYSCIAIANAQQKLQLQTALLTELATEPPLNLPTPLTTSRDRAGVFSSGWCSYFSNKWFRETRAAIATTRLILFWNIIISDNIYTSSRTVLLPFNNIIILYNGNEFKKTIFSRLE